MCTCLLGGRGVGRTVVVLTQQISDDTYII
jgi:hypothetical protein